MTESSKMSGVKNNTWKNSQANILSTAQEVTSYFRESHLLADECYPTLKEPLSNVI